MKTIDIKSLIIGVLLTSTIIFGMGATSPTDKWDDKQEWTVSTAPPPGTLDVVWPGKEPFAVSHRADGSIRYILLRKRIK